ncbi:MAG: trypsin-like serine protease [Gammaproteobacteria bacterium]|jgi:S1-C subfamily serine protease|nr:trypsin-like serine protease [Gammaproteobacteria bacterium]MBT3868463.1 trypsin-like serine protease [Gammaproteobacteria bacterium]MBT4380772.1 trypsin-like serine protease [Gammaproteobacteria bacterium]MBT4615235.1 trypsin-like serine protease [Gammaproteobacteria bacterium]MBT5199185.1 trypsin-like serine protease [Gammaproteobacteria bacterium]
MRIFGATLVVIAVTVGIFVSATNKENPTAIATAETTPVFLTNDEQNNISVFKSASPSVVFVTNTQLRRQRFSLNVMEIPRGSGTGFIWDESGLIVTNFHVVQGANKITIELQSNKSYQATIVGSAPEKDIALLKIDAPNEDLQPLPLGDSTSLAVGRKVLAIGNPFALDTTLTVGVVSALGREIKSVTNRTIKNVIQTDAAINPGNSGGPLLNSTGQLVGVNTAIYSPTGASAGIGFAIPVNAVKVIIPQLIEHGKLIRPVLGIETLTDYWTRRLRVKGVAILSVREGLPAAKAGMVGVREDRRGKIHLGDVIIAINGQNVINEDSLLNQLEQFSPGDNVKVTTLKDEKIHNYNVQLVAPAE